MPTSGGMLGDIQDKLLQEALANLGPEWQRQPLPAQIEEAKRRLNMMQGIDNTSELSLKNHEKRVHDLQDMQSEIPAESSLGQLSYARRRLFDLKTAQFGPAPAAPPQQSVPQQPSPQQDAGSGLPKFQDASQLRDFLAQSDIDSVRPLLSDMVSNNPGQEQSIDDAVNRFFEAGDPQRQLELATVIFNALPQAARNSVDTAEGDTQVVGIEQKVQASNRALQDAAVRLAQSSKPVVFNSSKQTKTAQHKGLENVMMFGPDQVRVDPFTGQLISKWHIYERNKGYGIRMNDALDVDFEAIWRGTVMDKYSSPYRNADGEYVGGYINKRFEVDRMVPEGNNYQLLPGQKRRAYLPEYRSTEARLQHMRSEATNGDLKPEYHSKEKPTDWAKEGTEFSPFNWKKSNFKTASADSKKKSELRRSDFFEKILKANISLPQGGQPEMNMPNLPGDEPIKGGPRCKVCGTQLPNPANPKNQAKGNLTKCPMCGADMNVGGQWTNPFNQTQQTPFNKNVVVAPQIQRAAHNPLPEQAVMPTNSGMVRSETPTMMNDRTHVQPPSVVPQQSVPQSPQAVNPAPASVLLSDENAENTDEQHLGNVAQSAHSLGL